MDTKLLKKMWMVTGSIMYYKWQSGLIQMQLTFAARKNGEWSTFRIQYWYTCTSKSFITVKACDTECLRPSVGHRCRSQPLGLP